MFFFAVRSYAFLSEASKNAGKSAFLLHENFAKQERQTFFRHSVFIRRTDTRGSKRSDALRLETSSRFGSGSFHSSLLLPNG